MRVLVTGATGLVGGALCRELAEEGHEVVALTRRQPEASASSVEPRWVQADPACDGDWTREIDNADAVVHLAGASIASGRWTARRKRELESSRIDSTRLIRSKLDRACASDSHPRTFVCASATGFYGSRAEAVLTEASGSGDDYLSQLCVRWEGAALAPSQGHRRSEVLRVVTVRFGVVLSQAGGALALMRPLFWLGLGGPLGPGDRWWPWIHLADATGLVRFALAGGHRGPLNAVSPGAVRMREFARTFGAALRRPAILPAPMPLVRIALGEMADGLSPGQHVVPEAAIAAGYAFRYSELSEALSDCVSGVS